jgi:hypothetical protein
MEASLNHPWQHRQGFLVLLAAQAVSAMNWDQIQKGAAEAAHFCNQQKSGDTQ